MMTSVLPAPVSAPAVFDPVKGVPLQSVDCPEQPKKGPTGSHAGIIKGTGKMIMME